MNDDNQPEDGCGAGGSIDGSANGAFCKESEGVRIKVIPSFVENQSFPENQRFLWSYAITVTNLRDEPVRLLRRYWRLTDECGRVDEVRGEGVVGEQPTIAPGKSFEYASAAPLRAPSGVMGGHFEMTTASGEAFIAQTPLFSLDSPFAKYKLN